MGLVAKAGGVASGGFGDCGSWVPECDGGVEAVAAAIAAARAVALVLSWRGRDERAVAFVVASA